MKKIIAILILMTVTFTVIAQRDYTQIRHKYKLAIEKDGKLHTNWQAMKLLRADLWPDVPFVVNIPVMLEDPGFYWNREVRQWLPDPTRESVLAMNEAMYLNYIEFLQTPQPQVKFVLIAYNPIIKWFVVPDQFGEKEQKQWAGFAQRSISATGVYQLKKLVY